MECLRNGFNFLCCISVSKFPQPYEFNFGSDEQIKKNGQNFQTNFVRTSKYHWYDFLPKSLFLQFKRLANIYFLIIGILQSIPQISPLGPLTAWAPLIVVLAISMIRQGYQDYQRYKADFQLNYQSQTKVFRDGQFKKIEWSDIIVGQIVLVQAEELFPADLILISSSNDNGTAFIQTASLDGQKNLKPRNAFQLTQQFNSVQKLKDLSGQWIGTIPDKQLHNFTSSLILAKGDRINFNKDKQLLYRGTRLKNTKFIYGLVIYTGRNTKIMLNSDSLSDKMSQIEVKVNYILGVILLIQVLLCLILAILDGFFLNKNKGNNSYIIFSSYSDVFDSFLTFCSYLVLLNTMIPISLIVSIEIVKMSQSYFIDRDKLMYSDFRKKYCSVKSASLNQQLGQIQYVFTDKTGTLTMNLMEFKIAAIGRKLYGDLGLIMTNNFRPAQSEKGFHDMQLKGLLANEVSDFSIDPIYVKNREGSQSINFKQMKQLAHQFLMALSVAHEVVAQQDKQGRIIYQGPSPDEITLVEAAKDMGYEFVKATQSTTEIKIKDQKKVFQLLEVFPFNSDRKRMSIIIRSNGMIKMYIKGADSIIKARLNRENKLNLDEQIDRFAKIGLRTLLIAMRIISPEQYKQFKFSVDKLPPANKEEAYNQLVSQLQTNLYLIGATAVLDRLQEQVPQIIRDLLRASNSISNIDIKVWMLTGDKMETAENIAKSCNLIQNHFQILKYKCASKNETLKALQNLSEIASELKYQQKSTALLIQGEDLTPIIGNQNCQKQLANLSKYCDTVVCCRLLPIQKAEVVRIVRQKLNKITLSIGDGSNDVPMIKTAHIGIGLFGQEGMGAVLASDYALPEFRMLWRLLFVHGRWNYIRIAQMVLYFFYKNMLFTIPQFIYAFYCGFSGQTIFDDVYISLYNLFFTSFPLIVRAVLQQDVYYVRPSKGNQIVEDSVSHFMRVQNNSILSVSQSRFIPKDYEMNKYLYRLFPKIYFIGQDNCIFNYTNFFLWTIEGAIQATMICLFSIYILGNASMTSSGHSSDLWIVSLTIFTSVIFLVTFKLSTHTKFWSVLLFFSIVFLSLGLYVGYMWFSDSYLVNYMYVTHTITMFFSIGSTYLIVLFSICFVLFIDGFVLSIDFKRAGYSSKMRMIIESEKQKNKQNYRQYSIKSSQINTIIGIGTIQAIASH